MQRVLEPQQRRGHPVARRFERVQGLLLALAGDDQQVAGLGPVELVEDAAGLGRELRGVDARARRDGEGGDHAGHGGVDAGLVHEVPQHRAQGRVDAESPHAEPVRGDQRQRAPRPRRRARPSAPRRCRRGRSPARRPCRRRWRARPGTPSARPARRGATSASTPRAKAMSVAVGIAQPPLRLGRRQRQVEAAAGTATPPRAAAKGRAAWRSVDSSPTSSSRLISRPTSRKNTAISASFTHCCAVSDSGWASGPTTSRVCQNASYAGAHDELAAAMATSAAASSTSAAGGFGLEEVLEETARRRQQAWPGDLSQREA